MNYFVNNIKNGNFENVYHTSPFYYDSLIKKISPREMINYFNAIIFQNNGNIPIEYYSIIKYSYLGQYTHELRRLIIGFLLYDEFPEFVSNLRAFNVNHEILENYFLLMNIENLRSLELIRMDIYSPSLQFSERSRINTTRQFIIPYGCDDKIEYTVLYTINGIYYIGAITIVKYESNWYIYSFGSIYANISRGSLIQISSLSEYLIEYVIR